MVIILDLNTGTTYNFKTKKAAGRFLGVSAPTLRGWLRHPFFLWRSLILTATDEEKVKKSLEALSTIQEIRLAKARMAKARTEHL